jgi:hypothetical protein
VIGLQHKTPLTSIPMGQGFVDSNLAKVDGFVSAMKIHSSTSIKKKVKPEVPCCTFTTCKRTFYTR